ncbi:MAG: ribosome small subunit-dependent GTPase A [Burkholderiales bacterium]|nr:ribosome small subunit-dependent GTPase A [Burkholderiales bacterium]
MTTYKIERPRVEEGLIISSFGRQYIAESNKKRYQTVSKGKKTEYVVGDIVDLQIINDTQAQIMELEPRKNLIYRSDQNRSKMIASNVDQVLIVIAVKPNFNINFLNSCLLACESGEIDPIVIINKSDLAETPEFSEDIHNLYNKKLNYQIIQLSALDNCSELHQILQNKTTVLIGQSGVGKSTITNQIHPNANARTGEIAKYENSGTHTTTNASLYHINETSDLIDCPGLQEFGLFHLDVSDTAHYFPEMRELIGKCKFNNCIHVNEPQCAIIDAVNNKIIDKRRYLFYTHLINRLQQKKHY